MEKKQLIALKEAEIRGGCRILSEHVYQDQVAFAAGSTYYTIRGSRSCLLGERIYESDKNRTSINDKSKFPNFTETLQYCNNFGAYNGLDYEARAVFAKEFQPFKNDAFPYEGIILNKGEVSFDDVVSCIIARKINPELKTGTISNLKPGSAEYLNAQKAESCQSRYLVPAQIRADAIPYKFQYLGYPQEAFYPSHEEYMSASTAIYSAFWPYIDFAADPDKYIHRNCIVIGEFFRGLDTIIDANVETSCMARLKDVFKLQYDEPKEMNDCANRNAVLFNIAESMINTFYYDFGGQKDLRLYENDYGLPYFIRNTEKFERFDKKYHVRDTIRVDLSFTDKLIFMMMAAKTPKAFDYCMKNINEMWENRDRVIAKYKESIKDSNVVETRVAVIDDSSSVEERNTFREIALKDRDCIFVVSKNSNEQYVLQATASQDGSVKVPLPDSELEKINGCLAASNNIALLFDTKENAVNYANQLVHYQIMHYAGNDVYDHFHKVYFGDSKQFCKDDMCYAMRDTLRVYKKRNAMPSKNEFLKSDVFPHYNRDGQRSDIEDYGLIEYKRVFTPYQNELITCIYDSFANEEPQDYSKCLNSCYEKWSNRVSPLSDFEEKVTFRYKDPDFENTGKTIESIENADAITQSNQIEPESTVKDIEPKNVEPHSQFNSQDFER